MGAVILARLSTLSEAHILAGVLNQNGIETRLGEAEFATIYWFAIPALGGISVYVPSARLEEARKVIIETVAIGADQIDAEFGPYEHPRRYGRWAV